MSVRFLKWPVFFIGQALHLGEAEDTRNRNYMNRWGFNIQTWAKTVDYQSKLQLNRTVNGMNFNENNVKF